MVGQPRYLANRKEDQRLIEFTTYILTYLLHTMGDLKCMQGICFPLLLPPKHLIFSLQSTCLFYFSCLSGAEEEEEEEDDDDDEEDEEQDEDEEENEEEEDEEEEEKKVACIQVILYDIYSSRFLKYILSG